MMHLNLLQKKNKDFYILKTGHEKNKGDNYTMSTAVKDILPPTVQPYPTKYYYHEPTNVMNPQPTPRRDFLQPKQQTPMSKVSLHATPPPLSGYNQNTTGRMSQLTSLSLGTPDSPFEFPSPYFPPSQDYKVERRFTKARRFREPTPMYDSTSSSDNFPDARIKVLNAPKQTAKRSSMATIASPWDPMSASMSVGGPTPTNLVFL